MEGVRRGNVVKVKGREGEGKGGEVLFMAWE